MCSLLCEYDVSQVVRVALPGGIERPEHIEWVGDVSCVLSPLGQEHSRRYRKQQPDPRMLLVEITEADIGYLQQWPPTDETLAQVLNILQRHQPKVIGLDLVRDIPSMCSLLCEYDVSGVVRKSALRRHQAPRAHRNHRVTSN